MSWDFLYQRACIETRLCFFKNSFQSVAINWKRAKDHTL